MSSIGQNVIAISSKLVHVLRYSWQDIMQVMIISLKVIYYLTGLDVTKAELLEEMILTHCLVPFIISTSLDTSNICHDSEPP